MATREQLREAIDNAGVTNRDFMVVDGLTFEVVVKPGYWQMYVYEGEPEVGNRLEVVRGDVPVEA